MKSFLLVLATMLTAGITWADTPYPPEVASRFATNEAAVTVLQTGTAAIETSRKEKVVEFTFLPASMGTIGYASTGVTLPSGAVITKSYTRFTTAFSPATIAGTLSIGCGTTGAAIQAAGSVGYAVNTFRAGASDGAAANFATASSCDVTARIQFEGQTSGALKGWLHYIIP